MRTQGRKTALLGELVATVFDKAARCSADPREVSQLATEAVRHLLRGARRTPAPLHPPMPWGAR